MVIFVRNSFKLNFIFLYQSTGHETMFYRFQYVKFSPDHSHAIISFFLHDIICWWFGPNYSLSIVGSFTIFQIFDGHNGSAAAIFTRDHLLNHVLNAIPRGLGRDEWLQALPRALVAGFVKTDKEFQSRGMEFCLFSLHLFQLYYGLSLYLIPSSHLIFFRTNFWNHSYICNSRSMDCYCCICWRFPLHFRYAGRCCLRTDCRS